MLPRHEVNKLKDLKLVFQTKIMNHSSAHPFLVPVDTITLGLTNYFDVVKFPMDFGTVMENLKAEKYMLVKDFVMDVRLVFKNACLYNPPGHPVHSMSISLGKCFEKELLNLFKRWQSLVLENASGDNEVLGVDFMDLSLTEEICGEAANGNGGKGKSKGGKKGKSRSNSTTTDASNSKINSNSNRTIEVSSINAIPASSLASPASPSLVVQSDLYTMESNTFTRKKLAPQSLLAGGSAAVAQAMLGEGENSFEQKKLKKGKKKAGWSYAPVAAVESKVICVTSASLPPPGAERRASWLGEEMAKNVQRMRNEFFVCDLQKQKGNDSAASEKAKMFASYVQGVYDNDDDEDEANNSNNDKILLGKNPLVDARHTLLEVSQFKHYQFDTLRRAKQSSSLILYHLHNPSSPNLVPQCSICAKSIKNVRWHGHDKEGAEVELCAVCMETSPEASRYTPYRTTYQVGGGGEEEEEEVEVVGEEN